VDTSEGVMKVLSVQSSDGEEMGDNDGAATAREDGENVHHEEEEEDKGLGRELEDEDFDEGISDISTHDTIINPSSSNSKYANLLLGTRTKNLLVGTTTKDLIFGTRTKDLLFGTTTKELLFGARTKHLLFGTRTKHLLFGTKTQNTSFFGEWCPFMVVIQVV
jgi:hypothetical protein